MSPVLDVFITFLSIGKKKLLQLRQDRETLYPYSFFNLSMYLDTCMRRCKRLQVRSESECLSLQRILFLLASHSIRLQAKRQSLVASCIPMVFQVCNGLEGI